MACNKLHIVNSVTVSETGGSVTLNFSRPITLLEDKERFCFKIPCGVYISPNYENYLVLISYNGTTLPLWNKYGNVAKVKEIRKGRVNTGFYGTENTAHIISNIPISVNCGCSSVL